MVHILRWLTVAFATTCLTTFLQAQSVVVTKVSAIAYPQITATAYGLSAAGSLEPIDGSSVTVRDNGADITSTVVCESATQGVPTTLMLAIDVSSSTAAGSPTSLAIQKAAAKAAERVVSSVADEVGVIAYDQHAFLALGPTQDRSRFNTAVDGLSSGNGVSLRNAFDSIPMGIIPQLVTSTRTRAVILMTDGMSQIDAASLRDRLIGFRIQLYVIGIHARVDDGLREVAEISGGAWADNVSSVEDAENIARGFAAQAKQLAPCAITWTIPTDCARIRTVEMRRGAVVRTRSITVPIGTRGELSASTTSLNFGPVTTSTRKSLEVTITARNKAIQVSEVRSSNSAFAVIDGATPVPFTIPQNQSRRITVEYTSANELTQYGTITFGSNACDDLVVHAKSSFANQPQGLVVVEPNGGEQYEAGKDTLIRWSGLLPEDVVRIDVSSDNGRSWMPVTEAASGLSYNWSPGPGTGDSMRVRIQQTVLDPSRVVNLQGHSAPVYAVAFTSNGSTLLTASHDRTARVWDATTGTLRFALSGHTDWVTGVAAHPTEPLIVTGSYDGTVRFWDPVTGTQVGVVSVAQRVLSLDISPDGSNIVVGQDAGIMVIDVASRSVVRNVLLPQRQGVGPTPVNAIRFNRTGSQIVSGEGANVLIRNAITLDTVRVIPGHTNFVYAVDITPDDAIIVSGSADLTIRTWNAQTGTPRHTSERASGSWLAVQVRPGGGQMIAANGDGSVRILEISSLRVLNSLLGSRGLCYTARYNANGSRIATGGTDFLARVYDIEGLRLAEAISADLFRIRGTLGSSVDTTLGNVFAGSMIDRRVAVMRNTSNGPVIVRSINAVAGNLSEFTVEPLVQPVSVPPGGVLELEVVFAPITPRTSSVPEDKSVTLNVSTGTGLLVSTIRARSSRPRLVSPQLINFQRRIANVEVVDTVFTIANSGGGPITVLRADITGVSSEPFTFTSPVTSFTLASGTSRQLRLRFSPVATGRFSAKIVFTLEGEGTVETFLYGEGAGDARISTSNSIVYETSPCNADVATRQIRISNSGEAQLNIFDIVVEGAARQDYSVQNSDGSAIAVPFSIASGAFRDFNVLYSPGAGGIRIASVVIVSDALNALSGLSSISLVARRDSVQFSLSSNVADFGNVPQDSVRDLTLSLLNSSSTPLRWSRSAINVGQFRILSVVPDITPPGQSSIVTIRFLGGKVGETFASQYVFRDSVCGREQVLQLRANVKDYIGFDVRPASVRTVSGTTVSIPVYITNRTNLDRTAVTSITATFSVNGTLLLPSGSTPVGSLSGDGRERTFSVDLPIPRGADSLSTTLQFSTAWGNDSVATIAITDIVVADTLEVTLIPGRVTFDDICRAGGVSRFFERTGAAAGIVVRPLPTSGRSTLSVAVVETGSSNIVLVDVTGRPIATLHNGLLDRGLHEFDVDLSAIPAGTYWLVYTTPSDRLTTRMDVSK